MVAIDSWGLSQDFAFGLPFRPDVFFVDFAMGRLFFEDLLLGDDRDTDDFVSFRDTLVAVSDAWRVARRARGWVGMDIP